MTLATLIAVRSSLLGSYLSLRRNWFCHVLIRCGARLRGSTI